MTQLSLFIKRIQYIKALILFCVLSIGVSTSSFSQLYSDAYQFYIMGEFYKSELAYLKELREYPTGYKKSKIYKMLGIAQYMQGKKVDAARSFYYSKRLNPYTKIKESEVIDASVINFFESISRENPTLPSALFQKSKTYVRFIIKPSTATLLINGKAAQINRLVEIAPGKYTFQVYAKNYLSHVQTILVKDGQINNIPLSLKKRDQKRNPSKFKPKAVRPFYTVKEKNPWTNLYYFSPFGTGQFYNKRRFLGVLYAFGQAGAFYTASTKWLAAEHMVDDINSESRRLLSEAQNTYEANSDEYNAAIQDINQNANTKKKRSDELYRSSYLFSGMFGVLWFISSLQAYTYGTDSSRRMIQNDYISSYEPAFLPVKTSNAHASGFMLNLNLRLK